MGRFINSLFISSQILNILANSGIAIHIKQRHTKINIQQSPLLPQKLWLFFRAMQTLTNVNFHGALRYQIFGNFAFTFRNGALFDSQILQLPL